MNHSRQNPTETERGRRKRKEDSISFLPLMKQVTIRHLTIRAGSKFWPRRWCRGWSPRAPTVRPLQHLHGRRGLAISQLRPSPVPVVVCGQWRWNRATHPHVQQLYILAHLLQISLNNTCLFSLETISMVLKQEGREGKLASAAGWSKVRRRTVARLELVVLFVGGGVLGVGRGHGRAKDGVDMPGGASAGRGRHGAPWRSWPPPTPWRSRGWGKTRNGGIETWGRVKQGEGEEAATADGVSQPLFMWWGMRGRVKKHAVRKEITFWQKRSRTCDFHRSAPPPTSLDPDRWVQREGYGKPNMGEKRFQLFSIFIV